MYVAMCLREGERSSVSTFVNEHLFSNENYCLTQQHYFLFKLSKECPINELERRKEGRYAEGALKIWSVCWLRAWGQGRR